MESRTLALFAGLLLLIGASAAVLIAEDRAGRSHEGRTESFQHLVGGLGYGSAVDLSGCVFAFDPRLDGGCPQPNGPIPGGVCFCPRHGGSILAYPPLMGERDGDASAP